LRIVEPTSRHRATCAVLSSRLPPGQFSTTRPFHVPWVFAIEIALDPLFWIVKFVGENGSDEDDVPERPMELMYRKVTSRRLGDTESIVTADAPNSMLT
jgi:hypothetical protein